MHFIRGLENFPRGLPELVVTIGNFDGVHLGHRQILEETVKKARQGQGVSLAFIFDPHPLRFLKQEKSPPLLTTLSQKVRLIQNLGIDFLLCAAFDKEMLRLSPRRFAREVLVEKLQVREIVEGSGFTFGNNRTGTAETLCQLGQELGFRVTISEYVQAGGETISSSRIRKMIPLGRVGEAAELLGHPYFIEGRVVEGNKRGKKLGFPTANLASENELSPRVGVYASWVNHRSQLYPGVTNVGYCPTFGEGALTVETFILDFQQDIYGENISLYFMKRLRNEMKFNGPNALVQQMGQDVENAKRALNGLKSKRFYAIQSKM
jgi:riboflavin kinase/FMN adenylyltransferase